MMKAMKVDYQIFIASSLRLQEHRNAVEQAIAEVNQSAAKECNVHFDLFRYEKRPDIRQRVEKKDAQEPADKALDRSAIFLLIIDDVIRDLTQYEFEIALHRFEEGKMPQDIFVLYREGTATAQTDAGISYDQFERLYNLKDYVYNLHNIAKTHKKVYHIPFDGINEGEISLKRRVVEILEKVSNSGALPYPKAVLGRHLKDELFFANDHLRLENSPKVYYRRQIDERLEEAFESNNKKIVLLSGSSLAGKTRAMMEALRNVNDGWVYVFNKSRKCNADELREICDEYQKIAAYLRNENAPKLYIGLDDIGLFLANNHTEDVVVALKELTAAVLASNKGVIVATSTDREVEIPGMDKDMAEVQTLYIGDMTESDFRTAIHYFKSCGISVDPDGLKYKMMGALFVNLKELRESFGKFLTGNDLSLYMNNEIKKAHCMVRKCLLRAIKAQSIWLDNDFGNLSVTRGLTEFFVLRKCDKIEPELLQEAFDEAINQLCHDGKMGIHQSTENKLDIQEYVYDYCIGFDGQVPKGDSKYDIQLEAEKRCIMEILRYCSSSSDAFKADEPLTSHLARFSSRCTEDAKKDIIGWLYRLWMNGEAAADKDKDVAAKLKEDRERCESYDDSIKTIHQYSHIIETYINHYCDFFAALHAFEECPVSMLTDHLLCAVMRKAKTCEDRERIRRHPVYERFKNDSYVIRAEIEWENDFSKAAAIFRRFNLKKTPAVVASQLLSTAEVPYGTVQLKGAMNTLITRVKTENDLETALNLMRDFFIRFVKNRKVLEEVKGNKRIVETGKLTIVDLLSKLSYYNLRQCLHQIYGGNIDASLAFLERLIDSVADTLAGGFTSETEIRLLISGLGSRFISDAAEIGSSFDTVYNTLFLALQAPHPKRSGDIVFRNTYTYTAMMKCPDCDIVKSINLFENDLVKHADDPQNPIYINRYTLNKLLEKCEKTTKEKKQFDVMSYLDRIERLFSQLDVKLDIFSYCKFLGCGKKVFSIHDCDRIVKNMSDNNIEHTVYSLTALMACNAIDLSMALSFVDIPAGLLGDYQVKQLSQLNLSSNMRAMLSDSDEAWSKIFIKPCETPHSKEIITNLISNYLEQEKSPEFFENGKVYNSIICNEYYLPTCEDAVNFVRQKVEERRFVPDSYTASHIISKAKRHGIARRFSVYRLNDFLNRHPQLIKDPNVTAARLRLYQTHNDQLPQVFVDADGKVTTTEMTPIMYVETMQSLRMPVNHNVLRVITSRKIRNITDSIIDRLLNVLVAQQVQGDYPKNGEPYSGKDNECIRERFGSHLDRYPELKMEPVSPLAYNKYVTNMLKNGEIDVNTALSRLDWTNEDSAVMEFNRILDTYIMTVRKRDEGLFTGVVGYYDRYFGPNSGHTPASYTFAVLASAISSIDDFRSVIGRFREQHSRNPRISLQPITLKRLPAVVQDIASLAVETASYLNTDGVQKKADHYAAGGRECAENQDAAAHRTNTKIIDTYLRTANEYLYRIARFLVKKDPDNIKPLLNDVFRYIIKGGDVESALCQNGRKYLLMDRFSNPAEITVDALQTIVMYNGNSSDPMTPDEIVEGIAEKYSRHIPDLINNLADELDGLADDVIKKSPRSKVNLSGLLTDKLNFLSAPDIIKEICKANDGQSKEINGALADIRKLKPIMENFVPQLFMRIKPLSRPVLNDSVLCFLADRIPRYDTDAYNEFMRQLYTIDCRQAEAAVPGLVNCIHRMSAEICKVPNLLAAIRKTEAQIFTYSEQSSLHCGHLLIEKAPQEYAGWCHYSMNGAKVSRLLEIRFGADRQSINEKIKFYINNLDDGFMCSLLALRRQSLTQDSLDNNTRRIIEKQEENFIIKIQNGEISFRDMQKQPLLWMCAKWRPTENLIIAMIRAYLERTVENDDEAQAVENLIKSLSGGFIEAKGKKYSKIAVKYSVLGSLNTEMTVRQVSAQSLAYALYLPMLRRLKSKKQQLIRLEKKRVHDDNHIDMFARCKATEHYFAQYLNANPADYRMVEDIFSAWRETDWLPSVSMIFAIIQSFSAIIATGSPDAEKVETRLDRLVNINIYAVKNGQTRIKLFLRVLGYECKGNKYVYISTRELFDALPSQYILILRGCAKKGMRIIYKSNRFNNLKAAEHDFFDSLNAESVPYPQLVLPDLWYKTNYNPYDEKLILKLIEHYVEVAFVGGRENIYLSNIKRLTDIAVKRGYSKTRLHYSSIGICSGECRSYIDVNTDKLKSVLKI